MCEWFQALSVFREHPRLLSEVAARPPRRPLRRLQLRLVRLQRRTLALAGMR